MQTRDELTELHELAASISDDVSDYRLRRRRRTDELILSRVEAARAAPAKRRRRHRDVAGLLVAILALALTAAVFIARPHSGEIAVHRKPAVTTGPGGAIGAAGRAGAAEIEASGRPNDYFSCLAKADQAMKTTPGGWDTKLRTEYIHACTTG